MADNMASGQNPSEGAPQGGLTDPLNMRTTDTGSMKRMSAEQHATQARKTIKLRPLSPKKETAVAPSDLTAAAPAAPVHPVSAPHEDGNAATVAMDRAEIERPSIKLQATPAAAPEPLPASAGAPPPSSSVPGVKQTIKLRPSSVSAAAPAAPGPNDRTDIKPASAQTIKLTPKSAGGEAASAPPSDDITEEKTVAMAKQTIRLVPKKTESKPAVAQPKPSDPTVNMQETATLKPSDPTIKLTPSQEAPAAQETKPKISLKKAAAPQEQQPAPPEEAMAEAAELQGESEASDSKRDEPSIIFTIAAVITLLLMAYLSLMLFGQFSNHWRGSHMSVPGCSVLNK